MLPTDHPAFRDVSSISERDSVMSAALSTERASRWARMLDDKLGRARAARAVRVPPGTIETLRRGRRKNICVRIWTDLRMAVIRELTREIEAMTHEIQIARQAGVDPREGEVLALEAAIRKAQEFRSGLG